MKQDVLGDPIQIEASSCALYTHKHIEGSVNGAEIASLQDDNQHLVGGPNLMAQGYKHQCSAQNFIYKSRNQGSLIRNTVQKYQVIAEHTGIVGSE